MTNPVFIFWVFLALCFILFAILTWHRQEKNFAENWPPIDDDEFIRRCRPGIRRETAIKVREIVSDQLGIPYDQIYPEQKFVSDLQCD